MKRLKIIPRQAGTQKRVEMDMQYIVFKQDRVQYKKLYKFAFTANKFKNIPHTNVSNECLW